MKPTIVVNHKNQKFEITGEPSERIVRLRSVNGGKAFLAFREFYWEEIKPCRGERKR